MSIELRQLHSMEKVFADEELSSPKITHGECLRGECFSFQIAYTTRSELTPAPTVAICSPLKNHITIREVGLVPSEYLGESFDENVLRTTPGLYPDVLLPCTHPLRLVKNQWRSLWVQVRIPKRQKAGVNKGQALIINRAPYCEHSLMFFRHYNMNVQALGDH